MAILAQLIANGIIAGSMYALVALGYTMVYGILKFINFAHGEVFMIGAYVGWVFNVLLGIPILPSILGAMLFCGILGYVMEKVGYKPLRNSSRLIPLISAVGISLLLQAIALMFFGPEVRTFRHDRIQEGLQVLGAFITPLQIIMFFTSIAMLVILGIILKKTKIGIAMRAATDNMEAASTVGINIDRVISFVFIIGSCLAGLAGVLVGMEQNLSPTMGVAVGIAAFAASVIGGIGSIYGAAAGAFLIGLAENLGIIFFPSGFKGAIAYAILILILLLKPTGLFGQRQEEAVRYAG